MRASLCLPSPVGKAITKETCLICIVAEALRLDDYSIITQMDNVLFYLNKHNAAKYGSQGV